MINKNKIKQIIKISNQKLQDRGSKIRTRPISKNSLAYQIMYQQLADQFNIYYEFDQKDKFKTTQQDDDISEESSKKGKSELSLSSSSSSYSSESNSESNSQSEPDKQSNGTKSQNRKCKKSSKNKSSFNSDKSEDKIEKNEKELKSPDSLLQRQDTDKKALKDTLNFEIKDSEVQIVDQQKNKKIDFQNKQDLQLKNSKLNPILTTTKININEYDMMIESTPEHKKENDEHSDQLQILSNMAISQQDPNSRKESEDYSNIPVLTEKIEIQPPKKENNFLDARQLNKQQTTKLPKINAPETRKDSRSKTIAQKTQNNNIVTPQPMQLQPKLNQQSSILNKNNKNNDNLTSQLLGSKMSMNSFMQASSQQLVKQLSNASILDKGNAKWMDKLKSTGKVQYSNMFRNLEEGEQQNFISLLQNAQNKQLEDEIFTKFEIQKTFKKFLPHNNYTDVLKLINKIIEKSDTFKKLKKNKKSKLKKIKNDIPMK